MQLRGKWVLLTGASSGLGEAMAVHLARDHGAHLVLVARREDRLRALASSLTEAHGVETAVVVADLTSEADVQRVFDEAVDGRPIHAAILNAGVSFFGHHDELDWPAFQRMLALNVSSVVQLTTLLLPYLEQRAERGGLMIVSSLAGLTPVAYQSAYSGTKAFLVHYGCGLHHEMARRGVSVTVFAPGGIDTEMTQGNRFDDLRGWLMPADQCARSAVDGLRKRRYVQVPGLMYRWGNVLTRLLPQSFFVGRVAAQYRRSLAKAAGPDAG
ncbi:MAG: SDR family NAD(P)-dependent oxidoreductase [Sandaracinaceae bacterium]|nr:SDR family NAD(P)-dependent oxidoreductase [Sandaracinaceae bacterium]